MGKLSYNPLLGRAIGPAAKLDADGNPYPSFSRVPGTTQSFPEGTLYYPDEYPAARDNGTGVITTFEGGAMVFMWRRGKWAWVEGSFRASNSNGNYQRFADGSQFIDHYLALTDRVDSGFTIQAVWIPPATFASPAKPGTAVTIVDSRATDDGTFPGNRAQNADSHANLRGLGNTYNVRISTEAVAIPFGAKAYVSVALQGQWR